MHTWKLLREAGAASISSSRQRRGEEAWPALFALTLCFPCLLPALSLPSAAVQLSFPSSFRSIILFSVLTDPTSVPKGEAGKLDRRAVGLRSLYSLIPCSPSLPSSPHRPSSKPSIAAPSASELYIKQPSPGQRVKDRQMDTLTAHGEFTGKAFFPVFKKNKSSTPQAQRNQLSAWLKNAKLPGIISARAEFIPPSVPTRCGNEAPEPVMLCRAQP